MRLPRGLKVGCGRLGSGTRREKAVPIEQPGQCDARETGAGFPEEFAARAAAEVLHIRVSDQNPCQIHSNRHTQTHSNSTPPNKTSAVPLRSSRSLRAA